MRGKPVLESTPPRLFFERLVSGALGSALGAGREPPTPLARSYLVELLHERVRAPSPEERGPDTLAEAFLEARQERGATRIGLLRSLGDRALFVSGFFGESLTRSAVGLDYYGDLGQTAYAEVAVGLAATMPARRSEGGSQATWPGLFSELAQRFRDFADVLAEVGDRTRDHSTDLLRIYQRYLETGSERDRRRLLRRGQLPPDRRRHRVC